MTKTTIRFIYSNNSASQHIATEQPEHAKKCETNGNLEISAFANSSKINVVTDSCNKNSNTSTVIPDTRILQEQHQELTQLRNDSSRITDAEPEIKPLTDINVNLEDITPGCYTDSHIRLAH